MKSKNVSIETLLERFFEGQTSNEEERQLYLFFKQDDVPEELVRMKPVFSYFESGLDGDISHTDGKTPNIAVIQTVKKRYRMMWGSVAASLLIILGATFFFFKGSRSNAIDPYEGSYIIRNGVRISDLNVIRPELEATMQEVMRQHAAMEQMLAHLTEIENMETRIMQQIEEQHRQITDHIQDENVRKEAEQILKY